VKLTIVDRNKCLKARGRELARRRLFFALSRFDSKIDQVTLSVRDLNGPKGGIDKRCQLRVKLRYGDDVILTDLESTVEACISRLADRAGRAVARRIDRFQDSYRRPRLSSVVEP
jgi:hypothetical protein